MNYSARNTAFSKIDVAIVGAGPYGLSLAPHLRARGVEFRIFGQPMHSWLKKMPEGMLLKSDGFASNLDDPGQRYTLERHCRENGIPYSHVGLPVRLDTFSAYGLAFKDRMVPEMEDKLVDLLEQSSYGFIMRLSDGEVVEARRVVLAVGITHFEYVPATLSHLPAEHLSHTGRHRDYTPFRGRSVAVIGAGASAINAAGVLHAVGASVQIVARHPLKFHSGPHDPATRPLWQRLRAPSSPIGPGLRNRFFTDAPLLFHMLPEKVRLHNVRTQLGPAGGWFSKEPVKDVPVVLTGSHPLTATLSNGRVHLRLQPETGSEHLIIVDHVMAGTGYRPDVNALPFLSPAIRAAVKKVSLAPDLRSDFQSSVPGLYFIGPAAANSFGPVMRFACGSRFAVRHLAAALARSRGPSSDRFSPVPSAWQPDPSMMDDAISVRPPPA